MNVCHNVNNNGLGVRTFMSKIMQECMLCHTR